MNPAPSFNLLQNHASGKTPIVYFAFDIMVLKGNSVMSEPLDSRRALLQPGERSGAWRKMRVNRGQEFVVGGYTVGGNGFDALIFGVYKGKDLLYVARTRNGFTPRLREELIKKFRPLESKECPFINLPEGKAGRWGAGLTLAKMVDCRWVKPSLVGQFEFVDWTPDNHAALAIYRASGG